MCLAAWPTNWAAAACAQVREGGASRSLGVEIAALAGLPASVVRRARELLPASGADVHTPR